MDAPLAQCTREEQRAVVRFLWSEGSSGTKIHQRLLAQYGDNALSKTTVYEWIEKFKTGRTSVKHAEGAGRPSTSTSEENPPCRNFIVPKDFMNDFLSRAKTDLQRLCYLINGNAPVSQNHLLSLLNLLFTGGG